MTSGFASIAVIGAGAWGTALANLAASTGVRTTLVARTSDAAAALLRDRENKQRLPGASLHEGVRPVGPDDDISNVDAILFVAPTQTARAHFERFAAEMRPVPVAIASKGVELSSGMFLPEVLAEVWPGAAPAIVSGPTFASEVAGGLPAAATLAASSAALRDAWRASLASPRFRLYPTEDVLGAALGGAMKNVLAIAAGAVTGAGLGESARAATIARGFAEARRLASAIGVEAETLGGLSGLGDLILTATSMESRNMSLGYEIGRGASAKDVLAKRSTVSEGALTAAALLKRADHCGVDLPICRAVDDLIEGVRALEDIISELLTRPPPAAEAI
ncbi:MAG: NAD(P)H-dependent glycerol-3-phosphate dehydrogenase [Pseudomonadota bacterium]